MLGLKKKPKIAPEFKRITHWRNLWYISPTLTARPEFKSASSFWELTAPDRYLYVRKFRDEDEAVTQASRMQAKGAVLLPGAGLAASDMCFMEAVPFSE